MDVDVKGRATNRADVVAHAAARYRVGVRAREDLRPDHAGTGGALVVPPRRDRSQLDQVPRVIVSDGGDRAIEGFPPIGRETRVVLEDEHGVEIALDAQFPESHVAERAPAHRRRAEGAARGRDLLGELFAVDGFEPLEVRRFRKAEIVDEVRAHRGPPIGVARHVDHEDGFHALRMVIA